LLTGLEIKDFSDIQSLFKEMVGEVLENGLEGELDEELGYSKYDYRNKETANSRNGHSKKTLKTSYGEVGIKVPRDRNGEFEPQLVKKQQTTLSGDIEEKINLIDYMLGNADVIYAIFDTYLGITDSEDEKAVIAGVKRFMRG
jgi:hypothetical protein